MTLQTWTCDAAMKDLFEAELTQTPYLFYASINQNLATIGAHEVCVVNVWDHVSIYPSRVLMIHTTKNFVWSIRGLVYIKDEHIQWTQQQAPKHWEDYAVLKSLRIELNDSDRSTHLHSLTPLRRL